MASPQKEKGYTAIANDILEKLITTGLNGSELSCVLFILRKTYGYHKKQDQISLSQFMKSIPVSRQSIVTALTKLQLVKIIRLVSKGTARNNSNTWEFNKDYDTWELVKKHRLVKVSAGTSQEVLHKLVKKPRHTKEIITKEIIQKKDELHKKTPMEESKEFFENEDRQNDVIIFLVSRGMDESVARSTVREFISYWTEPTHSGKKQKWQTLQTFEIRRRLATWLRRMDKFNKNKSSKTVTI